MHAKRTRDRKKVFVQEITKTIEVLNEENLLLKAFLEEISPQDTFSMKFGDSSVEAASPSGNNITIGIEGPTGFAGMNADNSGSGRGGGSSGNNNVPLTISVPSR